MSYLLEAMKLLIGLAVIRLSLWCILSWLQTENAKYRRHCQAEHERRRRT